MHGETVKFTLHLGYTKSII